MCFLTEHLKEGSPEQKVVVGTLANIASKVAEHQIQARTLTIIGEVVELREKFFDSQELC